MSVSYSPSVRVRRLAHALRGWREDSGAQGGVIARRAGWSAAKQSRLETGGQTITPADVMTLALIYDVSEEERNAVFNAALTAQEKGWWRGLAMGALTDDVLDYVELESEATGLRTFKIDLVHGLFQTEEYAEALLRAFVPTPDEDTVRCRVDARLRRQVRLAEPNPITVAALLAEAALHVRVGGPKVMRAQLDRLLELAAMPHVRLRVLPNRVGAHTAMGTGFNILSFGAEESDVVYMEFLHQGVYLEETVEVEPYRVRFADMWDRALGEEETTSLVAEIAGATR
jgi:transcriptional regulator with XRE-family HTH domain